MCTHTFISEETKVQFFEFCKGMDNKTWFATEDEEKVRCLQNWLGQEDFWFCHWEAENEDQIHESLDKKGASSLFHTMASEMTWYSQKSSPTHIMYE